MNFYLITAEISKFLEIHLRGVIYFSLMRYSTLFVIQKKSVFIDTSLLPEFPDPGINSRNCNPLSLLSESCPLISRFDLKTFPMRVTFVFFFNSPLCFFVKSYIKSDVFIKFNGTK